MRARYMLLVVLAAACGGTKKDAKDPSESTDPKPSTTDEPTKWEEAAPPSRKLPKVEGSGTSTTEPTTGTGTSSARPVNEQPTRRSDEYDKEATEVVLKRSARQVKENCGAAKDEDGKANGPWGKLQVQIALGHNGHSKGVTVPEPYAGKPVGRCIEKAFANLTFPPWAGADATVPMDVELVQPAK